jgi:hypothetical protein
MVGNLARWLLTAALCASSSLAFAQTSPHRSPVTRPVPVAQPRLQDVTGTRFIPPKVMALLNDRRIAPNTRFFLQGVASKPTEDWTVQEYQMTVQLVPTLTEIYISTATLSDFYDFLGLDPDSLFEPRLGNWTTRPIGFDVKNLEATQQAECFARLGYGENLDPTQVTLKAIAACTSDER